MNIATSLNRNYVLYTGVLLYSLCKNHQDEHIDAYLLHNELLEEDFEKLRSGLNQFDISIIPLKVDHNKYNRYMGQSTHWGVEAFYRLLLTDLLPEDVERLFYLDVDIIVHTSLKNLYEVPLEHTELVVCQDMCGLPHEKFLRKKQIQMFSDMFEKGHMYFNSGFLLMNMKLLREKYNYDYYIDVAEKDWNFEMYAPDQDLLNYVHWQNVQYVDWGVYDLFARPAHQFGITLEDVKQQGAVVHYAGAKPWESADYHFDIEKLWWEYAKETVFYPELLERFLDLSMNDTVVEQRINAEKDRAKRLIEINQKLLNQ